MVHAAEGILTNLWKLGSTLAIEVAEKAPVGIIGDSSRYWRALPFHPAFESIPAEMSEEEQALADG